jgi:hypothetical protein
MTDAAVVADSAPAPEPVGGAVINENAPGFSSPLGSQIPPEAQAKAEPAKPASLDDSIDRAIAKSAAKQAEPKVDAKVDPKADAKAEPVKEAPARGEGGKFAPKEPAAQVDVARPRMRPRLSKLPSRASRPARRPRASLRTPRRNGQPLPSPCAVRPSARSRN